MTRSANDGIEQPPAAELPRRKENSSLLLRYPVAAWFAALAIGVLAAVGAGSAPARAVGSPADIVNTLTSLLLLALVVLFSFIGLRGAWRALVDVRTQAERDKLEGYLVEALMLLFAISPLAVRGAVPQGTTPTMLAIVLPLIVNLLVAHRAVRAVAHAPRLEEATAHYVVVGAFLAVLLFLTFGFSFFGLLPEQLTEASDALILAATLLLLPEAIYLFLLVLASTRQQRRGEAPQGDEEPQSVVAGGRAIPVDLRLELNRNRLGIIQGGRLVGSLGGPDAVHPSAHSDGRERSI